ncbi:hypothetical protein FHR94_003720 [Halomonas cerina]|uniref:Uncharacterized protein n=1 Tax=Halomonas cerina TaxID=447424 RepID=A0A839VJ68_9GAMM|nr:hypothetical protein [Halomonas cerina]
MGVPVDSSGNTSTLTLLTGTLVAMFSASLTKMDLF